MFCGLPAYTTHQPNNLVFLINAPLPLIAFCVCLLFVLCFVHGKSAVRSLDKLSLRYHMTLTYGDWLDTAEKQVIVTHIEYSTICKHRKKREGGVITSLNWTELFMFWWRVHIDIVSCYGNQEPLYSTTTVQEVQNGYSSQDSDQELRIQEHDYQKVGSIALSTKQNDGAS